MLILDEKTGEVADKDISRPSCPFRSITDLKRKYYSSGEDYEEGTTLTQAEQYIPIIKMVERMLQGDDVEFIKELLKPSTSVSVDVDDEKVEAALDGVIPDDADPADYMNMADLSTETQAEVANIKQNEASSSSGEVNSDSKTDEVKSSLE